MPIGSNIFLGLGFLFSTRSLGKIPNLTFAYFLDGLKPPPRYTLRIPITPPNQVGLMVEPVNSVNGTFEIYVSNEEDPGCLGFTGDYDNKIHYKDPI